MSSPKFIIFSTERGASIVPKTLSPAPASLVIFSRDPIATGSYDPHAGTTSRGTVVSTLGGTVIQDFGSNMQDQRIAIKDEAAFTQTIVTNILSLYNVASTEYYFTDGYDCFKVQFARPNGFSHRRNLISSFYGVARFDYEINFVVTG